MTRLSLPYDDCPTCGLHWHLFAPPKIDGKEAVRCVECKAVYPLSSQAEPGYVVKHLEWEQPDGPDGAAWVGHGTDICQYYIRFDTETASYWMPGDTFVGDDDPAEEFLALDDAKAAAQADFEQRIRSAITTVGTAEPGYVAGFEACREAAIAIARQAGEPYALNTNTGAMMFRAVTEKIAAAIAALPAPATASAGWQDIETAPKDAEVIYLNRFGEIGFCHWSEALHSDQESVWWDEQKCDECVPRYWLPRTCLPADPTKRSAT